MSTLHTLHDAFTELERRADTLPATPENQASDVSGPTRRHPARRTLAPLAAAAAVAVVLAGGIIASASLWPTHTELPAASPGPGAITLWQAETASCPEQPAQQAEPDAVLRYLDGCVQLDNLAETFTSPLQAEVTSSNGNWAVQVTLNEQQTDTFARVTTDTVGHQLAIIAGGRVIGAPMVGEPITNSNLMIVAASADDAHSIAHILNNP